MVFNFLTRFFCCLGIVSQQVQFERNLPLSCPVAGQVIGERAADIDDGWVSVDRQEVFVDESIEEESGWIVFLKNMGNERFLVSLPKDPICQARVGSIELYAVDAGGAFHVKVKKRSDATIESMFDQYVEGIQELSEAILLKAEKFDEQTIDLFYRLDGKWVFERVLCTQHFLYSFLTMSDQIKEDVHGKFIGSFEVFS